MTNHGNKIKKWGYHPASFTEIKSRQKYWVKFLYTNVITEYSFYFSQMFGNINERNLRKHNPLKIFCLDLVSKNDARWRYRTLIFNIFSWWRHTCGVTSCTNSLTDTISATYDVIVQLSCVTSKVTKNIFSDFVSVNHAGWYSRNVANMG